MKSSVRFTFLALCLILVAAHSGCGSPQTASMATKRTLTGQCIGRVQNGAANQCGSVQDLTGCPAGQAAIKSTYASDSCVPPGPAAFVDASRPCGGTEPTGLTVLGNCGAKSSHASSIAGAPDSHE